MKFRGLVTLGLLTWSVLARADGVGDNSVSSVRQVPPPGVTVPAEDRAALEAGITALGKEIDALRTELTAKPALLELLPDVQIYYNAARYALKYNEFFNPNEIRTAKTELTQGMERAANLRAGKTPWTTQTGPVARGYVSQIDGSVQPYGIIVPTTFADSTKRKRPLEIWFHGRGETLSEVNFINDRQRSLGEFSPPDTFMLHPYGRYCNPNRFAGEVDTFEAMLHITRHYPVDLDRLAVRGFSLGGASCWMFATHYSGLWAAANPGAGFSETADFLKVYQNETLKPTWYEQKLWHLYDSIDYALNIYNVPTVAYSGELDGQRQAAEMMTKAMAAEGLTLTHVIGPGAHHFYEKNAKLDVAARVDALVAKGNDLAPESIKFTTWTLKYNTLKWLTVDAMGQEWDRARVDADLQPSNILAIKTSNVIALTVRPPTDVDWEHLKAIDVDGQNFAWKSGPVHFRKANGKWVTAKSDTENRLAKQHNLQGPIDDAFMSHFLMVRPTGTPMNAKVGAFVEGEMKHAVTEWRRQFRGEALVKDDSEITPADIASSNLILWGDPSSNKVLAKIAAKLPVKWDAAGVHVNGQTYAPDSNVPVLIYPNPLNPKHYIVLNSGFTFREYDYLNNARQTPKLPDWAIVDITEPPNARWPGKIVAADFFGEHWELMPAHKE
jgi:hypothetical protein